MSSYLGFRPTDKPGYYFVSYNNEDSERVGKITQFLSYSNLPIWYDFGLEYGEKWEQNISLKLKDAQAVLLFFTKGILFKENSYVKKEYQMATQFFNKKVYVIMMDTITNEDVPYDKVPWWIDIQEKQTLSVIEIEDAEKASALILGALEMQSHDDKMNQLIKNYKRLYDCGKIEEADAFLKEYLHGVALKSKAELISNLLANSIEGWISTPQIIKTDTIERTLYDHLGKKCNHFDDHKTIFINGISFVIGNVFVFHRGNRGDAHIIHIWREDKLLFTVGGLIDAYSITVHYDKTDDILYVGYRSTQEIYEENELHEKSCQSVLTIENPCGEIICNDFRFLI